MRQIIVLAALAATTGCGSDHSVELDRLRQRIEVLEKRAAEPVDELVARRLSLVDDAGLKRVQLVGETATVQLVSHNAKGTAVVNSVLLQAGPNDARLRMYQGEITGMDLRSRMGEQSLTFNGLDEHPRFNAGYYAAGVTRVVINDSEKRGRAIMHYKENEAGGFVTFDRDGTPHLIGATIDR